MSPAVPAAGQPTILVVDDEAVARTLLEYYLKKAGHRALVADSAATACKLIAQLGPGAIHCVVTDYNLPGESGLELLLWIRQADPTLAVIMITATTERETVAATLRGGASDFPTSRSPRPSWPLRWPAVWPPPPGAAGWRNPIKPSAKSAKPRGNSSALIVPVPST